jgi:excisionase family DNA binding protein
MEKLWTTGEVARYLGINDVDVEQLVREGQLTGYRLGGQFLRFRPSQVEQLKATMRFRPNAMVSDASLRPSRAQQMREFVYFYDFYLVSAGLLAMLVVYLMVSG